MKMKLGVNRFNYFIGQLQPMLIIAGKQKNPALWLYQNNARSPLFMLEALSKIYSSLHNKKKFAKIESHFKIIEDTLGAIDYYDLAAKDLAKNKKIPTAIIHYLYAQSREKIQYLNEVLIEQDWLSEDKNRINKIQKKLLTVNWQKEDIEVNEINEFYGESIYHIASFMQGINFQFTELEAELHEIRRKLRWLSIYTQALRGTIQSRKQKKVPVHLKKYCTSSITNAAFNKMPNQGKAKWILLVDQDYFYALSWLIEELGKLKDSGLHILAIKEALQQTTSITEAEANKKTYQLLGKQHPTVPMILENGSNICKTFFTEQNLEHLVIGVEKIQ
jgi:hypothetical protein